MFETARVSAPVGGSSNPSTTRCGTTSPSAGRLLHEVAAHLEVPHPAQRLVMVVRGDAGEAGAQRRSAGVGVDADQAVAAVDARRERGSRTGSRRARRTTAPPSRSGGPARRCACPRSAHRLRVGPPAAPAPRRAPSAPPPCASRAARARGRSRRRARRRPAPGARARRCACSTSRSGASGGPSVAARAAAELLGRLALVALAVGVEVAVVDLGDALHEHHRRPSMPLPVGSENSSATFGLRRGVVGLLRVAEAGGHADVRVAGPVEGRDGPRDRPSARVDRRELARDEPAGTPPEPRGAAWRSRGQPSSSSVPL